MDKVEASTLVGAGLFLVHQTFDRGYNFRDMDTSNGLSDSNEHPGEIIPSEQELEAARKDLAEKLAGKEGRR